MRYLMQFLTVLTVLHLPSQTLARKICGDWKDIKGDAFLSEKGHLFLEWEATQAWVERGESSLSISKLDLNEIRKKVEQGMEKELVYLGGTSFIEVNAKERREQFALQVRLDKDDLNRGILKRNDLERQIQVKFPELYQAIRTRRAQKVPIHYEDVLVKGMDYQNDVVVKRRRECFDVIRY